MAKVSKERREKGEREGKGGWDVIPIKRKTSLNFIRESVVTVCGGVSRVTRGRREEKFSLHGRTETDVSGKLKDRVSLKDVVKAKGSPSFLGYL